VEAEDSLAGLSDLPRAMIVAGAGGIVATLSATFVVGSLLLGARRLRRLEW